MIYDTSTIYVCMYVSLSSYKRVLGGWYAELPIISVRYCYNNVWTTSIDWQISNG